MLLVTVLSSSAVCLSLWETSSFCKLFALPEASIVTLATCQKLGGQEGGMLSVVPDGFVLCLVFHLSFLEKHFPIYLFSIFKWSVATERCFI